jgi:polysaccharide export outer membrane protein
MRAWTVKCLSALLAGLFLVGCGSSPYPEVSPAIRDVEMDYDYIIGPGDNMEIFVWGNAELSTSAVVRPDGKMSTRLVETIEASGRTPSQLARDIEEIYSEYVKHPVVTVIVNGFAGVPTQQVRVVGEATNPIGIPFRKHMTLLDLMIAVGGITDFAAGNQSVLVRNEDGRLVSYNVRIDDLIRDGDIGANLALHPGDILIIPESWF